MGIEFKDILYWSSPARWAAASANLLLKWVGQKTILGFLVVEALFALGCAVYFCLFGSVASSLGLWGFGHKACVVAAGARLVFAAFGFYAVWVRSNHLTKTYYGLFFASGFLAFAHLLPVLRLRCNCDDWRQCRALAAFAPQGKILQNPHQHPPGARFDAKRRVPYTKPPDDIDSAVPFSEEIFFARKKQMEKVPGTGLQELLSVSQRTSTLKVHRRVAKSSRKRTDGGAPELTRGSFPDFTSHKLAGRLSKAAHFRAKQQAGAMLQGPWSGQKNFYSSEMQHTALRFFNITVPGIMWDSSHAPKCYEEAVDLLRRREISRLLEAVRHNPALLDDLNLTGKLFLCASQEDCGAVSAEISRGRWDPSQHFYRVCQHWLQMVPRVARVVAGELVEPDDAIYFQRNPAAIKRELELTNANPATFYRWAFRSFDTKEGLEQLKTLQDGMCRCDPHEGVGCRTYKDSLGEDRFWCWVSPESRRVCKDQGFQLFWDERRRKIWSEDICVKAGCECSSLGMPPHDMKAHNLNTSLLARNHLNYGDDCKRWNTDDAVPWCYLGWTTTCADRRLDREFASVEMPDLRMQYRSSLPCELEEQDQLRESAREVCVDVSVLAMVLMLLSLFLYFPLVVIIFKFLANRCGDEFYLEKQFAVILSEEEEESEDEWEAGVSKSISDRRFTTKSR